jgi:LEA14-like dessication related protein
MTSDSVRRHWTSGAGALCHGRCRVLVGYNEFMDIPKKHRPLVATRGIVLAAPAARWRRGAARSLCLAAGLLALAACSLVAPKFNRPNVSVVSIEMRGGNLLQQNFAVKLNVQNPNDRALPVAGLHLELNVGGEQIASGVSDHAFVVPAFGESEFDMTIKANVALALLKLADRRQQHSDSIDYDVTGGASIDLPFLHDLPFHQTGSFSLNGM